MFLLDLLDSMPRLRLSTDQLKFVLWMLHELGVPSGKKSLANLLNASKSQDSKGLVTSLYVA
jgi:hypothetical protein